jgi:excisionase family DNA binding protein
MNTMAAGTTAPGGTGDRQPEGLLLTVDEAAERLRLGRTLVYRLISSGEPESVTVGGCGGSPPGASPSTLPHCAVHSASRESLAALKP